MRIINNMSILAVLLTGAALIREREHGTIEHLLVMPVNPSGIMAANIWANGPAIIIAAVLSLRIVVQALLAVPVAGSMPQFGLLSLPVLVIMNLLSGSTTPMESMPVLRSFGPTWRSWLRSAQHSISSRSNGSG